MGYRVLVVEDDATLADLLRQKLSREGHRVAVAKHQRQAYRLLDEQEFDFALLDLRLPTHQHDMDPNIEVGFAILKHIRQRFSADELPVIVMTAHEETSQTAVRALKAMANDYIRKPFEDSPVSLDEKLAGIARHLEQGSAARGRPADHRHKIVFRQECVAIDGLGIANRFADLLRVLGSRTFMLTPTEEGTNTNMTGREIAQALGVGEPTVRQYVTRFRKYLAAEFKKHHKGPLGLQDIIRNTRDWKGYELNFETAFIWRE